MHEQCFRFVAGVVSKLDAPLRSVVEIGGRNVNGTVRGLFGARCQYTSLDLWPGAGVDVVADGATWQPPEPVDGVVCCEVLEHAPEPAAIVANAMSMVRPGGVVIFTAAMTPRKPHSGQHGGPLEGGEHYANIDPVDLMAWLKAGCGQWRVETDEGHGDVYGVGVR